MQKSGIFGILEYSEPFHYCAAMHIRNPVIKQLKDIIIFPKRSILDLWQGSEYGHHVFYETYSEPCHVQNPYIFRTRDIFRTLSRDILAYSKCCVTLAHWEPCHIQNFNTVYLGTFRHIQAYSIMAVITLTFLVFCMQYFSRKFKKTYVFWLQWSQFQCSTGSV